jgi:FkbM family methyltransferase
MIKLIKKTLYKLLPEKSYLSLLHDGFYFLYRLGSLSNKSNFKYHYAVKYLIEDKDHVVDLGANLGYFAKTFAGLAKNGQVICVEPIPNFKELLQKKIGDLPNVKILHTALGSENGEITMVLPKSNGMIRTGLPHIMSEEEKGIGLDEQKVPLTHAGELFASFDKIDYIKCDIEGYEWTVFQLIEESLVKHKPMIQVEIGDENAPKMIELLSKIGYEHYGIAKFKIIKDKFPQQEQGDYLFVHSSKSEKFEEKMRFLGTMKKVK